MTVPVLVDDCVLPRKGPVRLSINRNFTINIADEEAQQQVHRWLVTEVSSNIGAESPTLVIGERPVWRVPAYLTFPRFGRVGTVGAVDVDVETGAIQQQVQCKIAIEQAADKLARQLPPYQPRQGMPKEALLLGIPAAPKLHLTEDDFGDDNNQQDTTNLTTADL